MPAFLADRLATHLGTITDASAAMTLDLYGHLYEDDLDALSEAMDRRYIAATTPLQARPERGWSDSPSPPARPERAPGRCGGATDRRTCIGKPCLAGLSDEAALVGPSSNWFVASDT
jgi:hypothetical protein